MSAAIKHIVAIHQPQGTVRVSQRVQGESVRRDANGCEQRFQVPPAQITPKQILEVRFVHAGNEMAVSLPENISLTLPFPYVKTEEDMS